MLFFFSLLETAFGAADIAQFMKLLLLVGFSLDYGLIIADVEHHVTTSQWEPWDRRETRRVR
jgi:hypothetical protein